MVDWLDSFLISGGFRVVMFIGLALLVHLQLGLTRVANFGVVGFWGLGLYVFGVLYIKVDWPFGDPWQFFICAIVATIVTGIAGWIVGWLIADLNDDGTLAATLGFATIVFILATQLRELTGGATGESGMGVPFDIGSTKDNDFVWLIITSLVVFGIFMYVRWVHRSPYGRLLIATGANEPLARSLGKSTQMAKINLFALTSAMMGLLGAMQGVMFRFLNTNTLSVNVTLAALVALIVGGTTRVWGAVVGVIVTIGLFEIVVQNYLPFPQSWFTQAVPVARQAIFGAVLVLVLIFRPRGILGEMKRPKLMEKLHDVS